MDGRAPPQARRQVGRPILGRRRLAASGTLLVSLLALVGCAPEPTSPFAGVTLYLNPDTTAAAAAAVESDPESRAAFEHLAEVPSAIWLLPEAYPAATITGYVSSVEDAAARVGQLPVFVVYDIPSRDCGSFSAGGTSSDDYGAWISAIADGIGEHPTVLIMEPDSLAGAPACGTEDATTALLADAITRLSSPQLTIYLDGGHSHWLPAEQMADLLTRAGVAQVRGFATNVSNYNSNADERAYGETLAELLGTAHFVVDTSRNGNGSNGEWCNPPGRAIGDPPLALVDQGAQDANLWIKTPGESDGTCNGGPAAGQWWAQSALELVRG